MPKIVFDTNVLLSAVLSDRGSSHGLVRLCAEGKVSGYTSKPLMEEFKEVIQRDYSVPAGKAEQMAEVFLRFLKLAEPGIKLAVVRDEPDNRVLECAVAVRADFVASWDPHLTDLHKFEEIRILNPGKILSLLKGTR